MSLAPAEYLGKRVYVDSFPTDWAWSRRVLAIRQIVNHEDVGHWEVQVQNWFWFEWIPFRNVRLVKFQRASAS